MCQQGAYPQMVGFGFPLKQPERGLSKNKKKPLVVPTLKPGRRLPKTGQAECGQIAVCFLGNARTKARPHGQLLQNLLIGMPSRTTRGHKWGLGCASQLRHRSRSQSTWASGFAIPWALFSSFALKTCARLGEAQWFGSFLRAFGAPGTPRRGYGVCFPALIRP